MTRVFTALIHKEGEWYVAECARSGDGQPGEDHRRSHWNPKEATELYLEEFPLPETLARS